MSLPVHSLVGAFIVQHKDAAQRKLAFALGFGASGAFWLLQIALFAFSLAHTTLGGR